MKHPVNLGNLFILIGLIVFSSLLQAAQPRVELDRNPVALDESMQVTFILDGTAQSKPDFSPLEKDFQILSSSQSQNISIVNGQTTRRTRYVLTLLPKRAGKLVLPPVAFGNEKSPATVVNVLKEGATAAASPAKKKVFMEVKLDQEQPYVQQQVIVTVRIYSRISWREAQLSEPGFSSSEVLVEQLGEDRQFNKILDGVTWKVIERKYAVFPQVSGDLVLQPMTLQLSLPSGRQGRNPFGRAFDDPFFNTPFSNMQYQRKIVRSQALKLKVRPVPKAFSGTHWLVAKAVRLQEHWSADPAQLKTGEPVTRNIVLTADGVTLGQLPDVQMPELDGLRIYPDDAQTEEKSSGSSVIASSTRKFAIIPSRAGTYQLPAIRIKWWNSQTDQEETAVLPGKTLVAKGAAVTPDKAPASAEPAQSKTGAADEVALPMPRRLAVSTTVDRYPWLIYSNLAWLIVWLLTLWLWRRSIRRQRGRVEQPTKATTPGLKPGPALQKLHSACTEKNAEAVRDAALQLSGVIWPEHPPRSLEALAHRVSPKLAEELNRLSRHLYSDGEDNWDGALIEQEMRALSKSPQARSGTAEKERENALKPLYPES